MLNQDEARQAIGAQAYGSDGDKIGKVGQVYLDDETNEPAWATVNTGLFGTSETFVPLSDASLTADGLPRFILVQHQYRLQCVTVSVDHRPRRRASASRPRCTPS